MQFKSFKLAHPGAHKITAILELASNCATDVNRKFFHPKPSQATASKHRQVTRTLRVKVRVGWSASGDKVKPPKYTGMHISSPGTQNVREKAFFV